jgi:hypothetical protein
MFRDPNVVARTRSVRAALGLVLFGVMMGCKDASTSPSGIDWTSYELNAETAAVKSGKSVFVFMYSEHSPASLWALNKLSSSQLEKLSKSREYVTFVLKYDNWSDPKVRHIVERVGHTKEPYLVYFTTNGSAWLCRKL